MMSWTGLSALLGRMDITMSEYMVYHPGTETWIAATECVLIDLEDLDLPEDWEFQGDMPYPDTPYYKIEVGEML